MVRGALALLGAGLLAWAWIGDAPTVVTVLGIVALALGCILPIRAAWRRARNLREHQRREGLLGRGIRMDVSSPAVAALVGAYVDLLGLSERPGPEFGEPAIAAAHGALLEVASLLDGRSPTSERELGYIEERAAAVTELLGALRELPPGSGSPDDDASTVDPELLIEAREELDQIARLNSVTRLEELTSEARVQRRGRD